MTIVTAAKARCPRVVTKAVWVSGAVDWRDRGEGSDVSRRPPPPLEAEPARSGPWFCRSAVVVQLLGALTWPALSWSGQTSRASLLALGFAAGGGVALSAALILHRLREHDRRTKYNALLAGQALLSWALLFAYYPSQRQAALDVGIAAAALLLLLPQAWLVHRLVRADLDAAADPASFRRAVTLYRVTRWAGPGAGWRSACAFVLSRLADPTGYCFFLARYFATEKLKRAKVIYLRAFHEPQADSLTAEAIVPLTARLPVEAWVHDRPADEGVYKHRSAGLAVRRVRVDDANWQLWLEHQLRSALAVIIDASRDGAAVSYELKLALQLMARDRIIVLLPEGTREPRSGLCSLTFDVPSPGQAARPLAAWLERIVASVSAGPRLTPGR
jgi:hypothetical protein